MSGSVVDLTSADFALCLRQAFLLSSLRPGWLAALEVSPSLYDRPSSVGYLARQLDKTHTTIVLQARARA